MEEKTTGRSGIYGSAIEAWQQQQKKAVQGINGLREGDAVYFTPNSSNDGSGHTGIYTGNGRFISATYNGVEENDLQEWQNRTGQNVLGYIPQRGN